MRTKTIVLTIILLVLQGCQTTKGTIETNINPYALDKTSIKISISL